ncbi:hypothetical protein WDU94_002519 [Cyamophila willieti]
MILQLENFRETLKSSIISGFGRHQQSANMVLKCLGFIMFIVTTLSMVFLFHWFINKSNVDLINISSPTEYTTITLMNESFNNPEAEELKMDPATRTLVKRSIPRLSSKNTTDGIDKKVDTANETVQSFTNSSQDSRALQTETLLNIESNDKNGPSNVKSELSKNCTSDDLQCVSAVSGILEFEKNENYVNGTRFKTENDDSIDPSILRLEQNLTNKTKNNDNSTTGEYEKLEVHIGESSKVNNNILSDIKSLNPPDSNASEESISKLETKNCTLDWNYIQQIEDYLKKYEDIKQKIVQDKVDLITPGKGDVNEKRDRANRATLLLEEQLLLDNIEKNLTALLLKGNFGETLDDNNGEFYPSTEISLARTLEGTTNDDPLNVPTLSTDVKKYNHSAKLNSQNKEGLSDNISNGTNLQSNNSEGLSYTGKEDKSMIPKASIDLRPFGIMTEKSTDDQLGSKPALKESYLTKNNSLDLLGNGMGIELNKLIESENLQKNSSIENQTSLVDFTLTHPNTKETTNVKNIQNEQSHSNLMNDTSENGTYVKPKKSLSSLNVDSENSEDKLLITSQSSTNLHPSGVKDEQSPIEKFKIHNVISSNKEQKQRTDKDVIQQNKTIAFVAPGTLPENETFSKIQDTPDKVAEILHSPNNTISLYKKRETTKNEGYNRATHFENFIVPRNRSLQFETSAVASLADQIIPSGNIRDSDVMAPFVQSEVKENKSTENKPIENIENSFEKQVMAKESSLDAAEENMTDVKDDSPRKFEFYEINNDYRRQSNL